MYPLPYRLQQQQQQQQPLSRQNSDSKQQSQPILQPHPSHFAAVNNNSSNYQSQPKQMQIPIKPVYEGEPEPEPEGEIEREGEPDPDPEPQYQYQSQSANPINPIIQPLSQRLLATEYENNLLRQRLLATESLALIKQRESEAASAAALLAEQQRAASLEIKLAQLAQKQQQAMNNLLPVNMAVRLAASAAHSNTNSPNKSNKLTVNINNQSPGAGTANHYQSDEGQPQLQSQSQPQSQSNSFPSTPNRSIIDEMLREKKRQAIANSQSQSQSQPQTQPQPQVLSPYYNQPQYLFQPHYQSPSSLGQYTIPESNSPNTNSNNYSTVKPARLSYPYSSTPAAASVAKVNNYNSNNSNYAHYSVSEADGKSCYMPEPTHQQYEHQHQHQHQQRRNKSQSKSKSKSHLHTELSSSSSSSSDSEFDPITVEESESESIPIELDEYRRYHSKMSKRRSRARARINQSSTKASASKSNNSKPKRKRRIITIDSESDAADDDADAAVDADADTDIVELSDTEIPIDQNPIQVKIEPEEELASNNNHSNHRSNNNINKTKSDAAVRSLINELSHLRRNNTAAQYSELFINCNNYLLYSSRLARRFCDTICRLTTKTKGEKKDSIIANRSTLMLYDSNTFNESIDKVESIQSTQDLPSNITNLLLSILEHNEYQSNLSLIQSALDALRCIVYYINNDDRNAINYYRLITVLQSYYNNNPLFTNSYSIVKYKILEYCFESIYSYIGKFDEAESYPNYPNSIIVLKSIWLFIEKQWKNNRSRLDLLPKALQCCVPYTVLTNRENQLQNNSSNNNSPNSSSSNSSNNNNSDSISTVVDLNILLDLIGFIPIPNTNNINLPLTELDQSILNFSINILFNLSSNIDNRAIIIKKFNILLDLFQSKSHIGNKDIIINLLSTIENLGLELIQSPPEDSNNNSNNNQYSIESIEYSNLLKSKWQNQVIIALTHCMEYYLYYTNINNPNSIPALESILRALLNWHSIIYQSNLLITIYCKCLKSTINPNNNTIIINNSTIFSYCLYYLAELNTVKHFQLILIELPNLIPILIQILTNCNELDNTNHHIEIHQSSISLINKLLECQLLLLSNKYIIQSKQIQLVLPVIIQSMDVYSINISNESTDIIGYGFKILSQLTTANNNNNSNHSNINDYCNLIYDSPILDVIQRSILIYSGDNELLSDILLLLYNLSKITTIEINTILTSNHPVIIALKSIITNKEQLELINQLFIINSKLISDSKSIIKWCKTLLGLSSKHHNKNRHQHSNNTAVESILNNTSTAGPIDSGIIHQTNQTISIN